MEAKRDFRELQRKCISIISFDCNDINSTMKTFSGENKRFAIFLGGEEEGNKNNNDKNMENRQLFFTAVYV